MDRIEKKTKEISHLLVQLRQRYVNMKTMDEDTKRQAVPVPTVVSDTRY